MQTQFRNENNQKLSQSHTFWVLTDKSKRLKGWDPKNRPDHFVSLFSTETAGSPACEPDFRKRFPMAASRDGRGWWNFSETRKSQRPKNAVCRVLDHAISYDDISDSCPGMLWGFNKRLYLWVMILALPLIVFGHCQVTSGTGYHAKTWLKHDLESAPTTRNTLISSRKCSTNLPSSWSDPLCKLRMKKVANALEEDKTKTPNRRPRL